MYITDNEGNEVWHGSAISELRHWKERALRAEDSSNIVRLEKEIQELKEKYAPFAKYETPEWKTYVADCERVYASRSKGPRDVTVPAPAVEMTPPATAVETAPATAVETAQATVIENPIYHEVTP
jgi:hypothetical protein